MPKIKQFYILGTKITNSDYQQCLKLIGQFIVFRKPQQIITSNPEMIMAAQDDRELKLIIDKASLVVPDGAGLVWAINSQYKNQVKRIAGVDLLESVTKLAAESGYKVFFLGAKAGIAQKAADILKKKYPKLKIAGCYAGKPNMEVNESHHTSFLYNLRMTDIKTKQRDPNNKIVSVVKKTKPDILFVAYGHGKQEKFIYRYKRILNIPVMMGVGGSFDFIAGTASRAPKWLQNIGLEWLWRFFHEPWRVKRIYTAVIKFPLAVVFTKKHPLDKMAD